MPSAAPKLGRLCLRWPGLVVIAVALSALVSGIAATQNPNEPTDQWAVDGGTVQVEQTTLTIREGESKSYRLRLNRQPLEDGWWVIVLVDGAKRYDGHYDKDGDGEDDIFWVPSVGRQVDVTDDMNAGAVTPWRNITIYAEQDADTENQTITFAHELWDHNTYCPPALHGGGTPLAMVTVHIIDDDGDLPSLSIEDATAEEGRIARFRVTLSKLSEQDVTVGYQTQNDTAIAGTNPDAGADYASKSGTLTFSAGTSEQFIEVQTHEDDLDEPTEEFSVELSSPDGAALSRGTGTGTITDDDEPTLSIEDATAVVEGGMAEFVVEMSIPSTQSVTVDYRTADGSARAGMDYTATPGSLTFSPNTTRQTIRVPTQDDATDELVETFTVTLRNPSGATVQSGSATGTINDNDVVGLSIADATVVEGNTARFDVTLSPASDRTVTVAYQTADGTGSDRAEAGTDYEQTSSTLTFSAGELSKTISVRTLTDSTVEDNETFTVTLSSPTDEATIQRSVATGTISDDDLPTLSIANATVEEGDTAQFVVTLSAPNMNSVTVTFQTASGSATEDTDYAARSGTLSFGTSASTQTQTISVPTIEDEIDEPNETFTVTLSGLSDVTLQPGTATGTITDNDTGNGGNGGNNGGGNGGGNGGNGGNNHNTNIDDGTDLNNGGEDEDELRDVGDPGLPKISIADTTVEEGDTARFVVTLSPASDQTLTVRYRTEDGTADEGTDYRAVSRTLTFVPGDTEQTILVWTHEDDVDDPNETFTAELSNPIGATLEDGSATGTIIEYDESVPLPKLSIVDTTVVEGGTAQFTVRLSPASEQTVTVSYRTASGTAVAGRDFDTASGKLTFAPGNRRQSIAVPTREDDLDEPDETFLVTLSNPSGATIQDGTATGTIADDDVRSLAPINRELLPEIGRALAFTAVRCRIEQAFSDMARGWAEPVVSPSLSVPPISSGLADGDGGSLELEDILANTSFLLPLMDWNGGTIRFATWGCGDYRSLAGDGGGDAGAWDGEAFSMQVGADAIVGRDLLAGVSLSQSRGSLDFDGPGGSDPAGGRYDLGLTGVHPYLGWWISPDLELWGTFGLAGGDLQVVDDAAGSSATSAATLASATVGINGRLLTYGAATLRLKGEGSLAQLDVSKGTGLFQGASANLQRLRLAAEVEYEHVIPDVGVLVPWGELGMRHEGGDGETGSSLELGGGLHYRNIEQGWNAEVYGRWLAVQDDAPLQEQGFGLRFRYDPETPGFGPWVSLTQTWGEPASALHRLWEDGASELTAHDPVERRLGVEFGYGFPAFGGRAALMPYSAVSLEDSDARGYRLGMRVSLGSSGLLSLETERRERPAASADHRIMLRAIARF